MLKLTGNMMDEQEFKQRADHAMEDLHRRLGAAGERHDLESDFNAGTLVVEFEDPPAKFVVSPQTPVRQMWISANLRSYKLDWDAARGAFVLAETGETLADVIARAISEKLGEPVSL